MMGATQGASPGEGLAPHNVSAEEALIAALLLDGEAWRLAAPIVRPQDLFRDQNRWIYGACLDVADRREEITVPTVAHELARAGRLDEAGGEPYLVEITGKWFTAVGVEAHARIVADAAARRRLITLAGQLAASAYNGCELDALREVHEAVGAGLADMSSVLGTLTDASIAGLVHWGTLFSDTAPTESWLFEPLIPQGRAASIFAPRGTGKSLVALDVSARLARGVRTLNSAPIAPVSVLYLDFEGHANDLKERLIGMACKPEDLRNLHYVLRPDVPPLDTHEGGAALLRLVERVDAELVVIDTVSRVISGDENDARTFHNLANFTTMPLTALGVALLRLDHAGKDVTRDQRGSSAKGDDLDVIWRLAKRGDRVTLTATKRRQIWVPDVVQLVQLQEPFRHVLADLSVWDRPEGVEKLATRLDDLDVPLSMGRDRARRLLQQAGETASNELLTAALKYRREIGEPVRGSSRTGQELRRQTEVTDRSDSGFTDRPADRFGQVGATIADRRLSPVGDSHTARPSPDDSLPSCCSCLTVPADGGVLDGKPICSDCLERASTEELTS